MSDVDILLIFLLILVCIIGFATMCLSDKEKTVRTILVLAVFATMVNIIAILFKIHPDKANMARVDTEVDKLIFEIRNDSCETYSDEDVQVIIFKYLLPYCKQGKYDNLDAYDRELVRRARNSPPIVKGGEEDD